MILDDDIIIGMLDHHILIVPFYLIIYFHNNEIEWVDEIIID